MAATAHASRLAFVFRTKSLWARIRDALELRAVLVIGALRIIAAVREASLVETGTAGTIGTLLCLRTRLIYAGEQTLPIDADAGLTALEVELALNDRRLGIWLGDELRLRFRRVQAQSVHARRTDHAVVLVGALAYASEVGADLADRAVDFVHTNRTRGSGLLVAVIAAADETAAVSNWTVSDAEVAGVVVAAKEAE